MKKRTSMICQIRLLVLLMSCLLPVAACGRGLQPAQESERLSESESTGRNEPAESEFKNEPPVKVKEETYELVLNREHLKVIGRSAEDSNGIACDWSASGIEVALDCIGDVRIKIHTDRRAYFTLYVDGQRQEKRIRVSPGYNDVLLFSAPEQGEHVLRLLKQTENYNANCLLQSLTFTGSFLPPAKSELYIEFYGDSITCGYGNLSEQSTVSDPGSALWQDATQSYAFLLAETLRAECSLVSVSGIGIAKGYRTYTMPEIWQKTNFLRGDEEWNFSRVPDLVMINLGTNDEQCGADSVVFSEELTAWIAELRRNYGAEVPILFLTGMMNDSCRAEILSVIAACGGETAGLWELCVVKSNRLGANGHPTLTAHVDVAAEIAAWLAHRGILKGDE